MSELPEGFEFADVIWLAGFKKVEVKSLRPSEFHDPQFTGALRRAAAVGVSVRAFSFRPTVRGFHFSREIPVDLSIYETNQIRNWSGRERRFSGWNHWNSRKDIT